MGLATEPIIIIFPPQIPNLTPQHSNPSLLERQARAIPAVLSCCHKQTHRAKVTSSDFALYYEQTGVHLDKQQHKELDNDFHMNNIKFKDEQIPNCGKY